MPGPRDGIAFGKQAKAVRTLVPPFITDQLQARQTRGEMLATALFVDISGFTQITNALATHGQHGAEVLADVMQRVFDPLVEAVYARDGFVAYFAGDAFLAIFPDLAPESAAPAAERALGAGRAIQTQMLDLVRQETPYGVFELKAKIGIGGRDVSWGILASPTSTRAAFYFRGSAVNSCVDAESHARPGELLVDSHVSAALANRLEGEATGEYVRVLHVAGDLPRTRTIILPAMPVTEAGRFYPPEVLEQQVRAEFRQTLSVFVGLQGEPDYETLSAVMERVFGLSARYGGLLSRINFGDKGCHLLLFWGAPRSYEDDVVRALNFALDLREECPIPVRLGITYRTSHAGFAGAQLHSEYTCYGQGVNLAARYMDAAPWGEIWADEVVARRAETRFRMIEQPARLFKGFAEPQRVYALERRREQAQLALCQGPIVGRQSELAALRTNLQTVFQGQFAGVTTVLGEPGMGKSCLVQEFLQATEREPVPVAAKVFRCQADAILRESLNPFRYWLRSYFDQSSLASDETNRHAFESRLNGLVARTNEESLARELDRTRSFLAALVGLRSPESLYEQVPPALRFDNTLYALKTLIIMESLQQPVILLVEDAQWLDPDSGRLLNLLTRRIAEYPLALLVTSREELAPGLFDFEAQQHIVRLDKLPLEAVATYLQAKLGEEAAPALVDFIASRTDRNPLFLEQMLWHLQTNGVIQRDKGRVTIGPTAGLMIPEDLRSLLVARLDRLPAAVRTVVQQAAVLGREFDASVLRLMLVDDAGLSDCLQAAERAGIWYRLEGDRYIFQHALLRDAAYDMQLHARLRELHLQAGRAFQLWQAERPERGPRFAETALHFDRAGAGRTAADYYQLAGDAAADAYENEDALAHYSRGLDLAAPDQRMALLLGREAIYWRTGQRQVQAADLAELDQMAVADADAAQKTEVKLRQAAYDLAIGNYAAARHAAEDAARWAEEQGNRLMEARAHLRLGRTSWQQGRYREAQPHLERSMALAQIAGSVQDEAEARYDLSVVAYYAGDYAGATTSAERALLSFSEAMDRQGELRCQSLIGSVLYAQGDYPAAEAAFQGSVATAHAIGWRYAEAHALGQLGNIAFELGRYQLARRQHEAALLVAHEIGHREMEIVSLDTLGQILHYAGEPSAARVYLEQALALEQSAINMRSRGFILTHLGFTLAALDEHAAAADAFRQALALRTDLEDRKGLVDVRAGLGRVALARGRRDEARAHVQAVLEALQTDGPDGVELPVQAYLIAYEVFSALDDPDATVALSGGYELLMERAGRIQDPVSRDKYLSRVPYNRSVRDAWQAHQKGAAAETGSA